VGGVEAKIHSVSAARPQHDRGDVLSDEDEPVHSAEEDGRSRNDYFDKEEDIEEGSEEQDDSDDDENPRCSGGTKMAQHLVKARPPSAGVAGISTTPQRVHWTQEEDELLREGEGSPLILLSISVRLRLLNLGSRPSAWSQVLEEDFQLHSG